MDLQKFVDYAAVQKLKIRKGKQEYLFNVVSQFGHDSPEAKKAVEDACPKAFIDRMKETIKIIPKVQTKVNLIQMLNKIKTLSFEKLYLKPKDLIELIDGFLKKQQRKVCLIEEAYGLNQYFTEFYKELIDKLKILDQRVRQQQQATNALNEFFKTVDSDHNLFANNIQPIRSLEQLKNLLSASRIFVKPECLAQLYETCYYFGNHHPEAQEAIRKSSYTAFETQLRELSQFIETHKQFKELANLLKQKVDEFILPPNLFVQMVQSFYNDKQRFRIIISDYDIHLEENEEVYQEIIEILTSFLKNTPERFHKNELTKIINFYKYEVFFQFFAKEKEQQDRRQLQKKELQLIKDSLKLNKIALKKSLYLKEQELKELYYSFISKDSDKLANLNDHYDIEIEELQIYQETVRIQQQIQRYFQEFFTTQALTAQYYQLVNNLFVQQDKNELDDKQKNMERDVLIDNESKQNKNLIQREIQAQKKREYQEIPNSKKQSQKGKKQKIQQTNFSNTSQAVQKNRPEDTELQKIDDRLKKQFNNQCSIILQKVEQAKQSSDDDYSILMEQEQEERNKLKNKSKKEGKMSVQNKKQTLKLNLQEKQQQSSKKSKQSKQLFEQPLNEPPSKLLTTNPQVNQIFQKLQLSSQCTNLPQQIQTSTEILNIGNKKLSLSKDLKDQKKGNQLYGNQEDLQKESTIKLQLQEQQLQNQADQTQQLKVPELKKPLNPFREQREKQAYKPSKISAFITIVSGLNFKPEFKVIRIQNNKRFSLNETNRSPIISYRDNFIAFVQFEMQTVMEYEIEFQEKTGKLSYKAAKKFSTKINKVNQQKDIGYKLIFIEKGQRSKSVANFALMTSIKYFVQFNPKNINVVYQEKVFMFLNLVYDLMYLEINLKEEQQIFHHLKISQKQPQVHSKYLLYFLQAIYDEKAQQKYYQYQLHKQFQFEKYPNLIQLKSYPQTKPVLCFYYKISYYHQLQIQKRNFEGGVINKLLDINMQIQPKYKIYDILSKSIQLGGPYRHLAIRNTQVRQMLKENPHVTALQYFNLRAKYINLVFQSLVKNGYYYPSQIHSVLENFLNDLIQKSEKNQILLQADGQIQQKDVVNVFLKNAFFGRGQLRISAKYYHIMMNKMKTLLNVSKGVFNFIKYLYKQLQVFNNIGFQPTQTVIMFLKHPCVEFDKAQLQYIFTNDRLTSFNIKSLCFKIIEDFANINQQYFLSLIGTYFQNFKSPYQDDKQYLIQQLQLSTHQVKDQDKLEFLRNVFLLLVKATKPLVLNERDRKKYIDVNNLKKYLDLMFKMKQQTFKAQLNEHIFMQIKLINIQSQLFLDIFSKMYQREEQKKQFLIDFYFTIIDHNPETLQKQVWDALKTNPARIQSIRKHCKKLYPKIETNIIVKLAKDDLLSCQLNQLYNTLKQVKEPTLVQIVDEAFRTKNRYTNFCRKINKMLQILKDYQELFTQQIGQLQLYFNRIESFKLADVYPIDEKYSTLFQKCDEIFKFKQYSFWKKQKILSLQTFEQQYQEVATLIQGKLVLFFKETMPFTQFQKFFTNNNIKDICEYFCKSEKQKQLLAQYHTKLKLNYIQKLQEFLESIIYLNEVIETQKNRISLQMNEKMKLYLQKMRAQNNQLLSSQLYSAIKEVEIFLIKMFNLNITDQNQALCDLLSKESSAIILTETLKAKKMFQMIQRENVDTKSISDLKEYINDLENSIIGLDLIKQFQNVIQYCQLIKQSISIQQFIVKLNELIMQKVQLSNNIKNCYTSYLSLQQKIKEAKNRQTSFKYQIEAIFKDSIFIITKQLEIQVQINNYDMDQLKDKEQTKIYTITYKKMNSYRDKSILLINDMSRSQSIDASIDEMIKVFKKFEEFFCILQSIHYQNTHLTNYGYNPEAISKTFIIRDADFIHIRKHKTDLQKISDTWINGIKAQYQKSYLLSHFIGKELNNFIKDCTELKYHQSLQRIIGVSKQDFQRQLLEQEFTNILKQAYDAQPLKRIQLIVEAFLTFQSSFTRSSGVQMINIYETVIIPEIPFKNYKKGEKAKPIILLTCNQKQIYSCFLQFSNNKQDVKIAEPSQVLFCQQQTTSEQIEVFLYRALIYTSKTHYIVRPHKLNQEVKLNFCNFLNILLKDKQEQLKDAQLCFVDSVTNDKLYAFINRPKIFCVEKKEPSLMQVQNNEKTLIQLLQDGSYVIQSKKAGLGKTFYAQEKARSLKKNIKYLFIAGNINFYTLSKKLKRINISYNDILLIQIGHVQNKQKLQIFLSQIILFRCFYYQQFIFVPKSTLIYVQMENIVDLQPQKTYNTIQILKKHKKHHFIQCFKIKDIILDPYNEEDKFVYIYLSLIDNPASIDNVQNASPYSYEEKYKNQKNTIKIPANTLQLIQKYFLAPLRLKNMEPTYQIFKYFKKILFTAFKTFADSPYFMYLQDPPGLRILGMNKARSNFLKICIDNTLQFLQQTITTNDFDQKKNQNMLSLSQKLRKFPMLILTSQTGENKYEFVYLSDELVKIPIKSLLLSQNQKYYARLQKIIRIEMIDPIFKETALCNKQGELLQFQMFKIIAEITGNMKFSAYKQIINQKQQKIKDKQTNQQIIVIKQQRKLVKTPIDKKDQGTIIQAKIRLRQIYQLIPGLRNYKLTLDNFFKMCLIIYRSNSLVPCIIMGESGVGKTALIQFLVNICFEEKLYVYNVHAGIHQEELEKWYKQFSAKANRMPQINGKKKRVWVFFDEFNTTDELNYIKQMMIDGRFMGETIPSNIVFLAACNPYRKKRESIKRVKAGIKKNIQNQQNNLAFKVKPPTLSMIQLIWDYQQLGQQQNYNYISKILEQIQYQKKQLLINAIVYTHEYLKTVIQTSAVSLRDVARFKQLFNWFLTYMPRQNPTDLKQKLKFIDKKINEVQRAVVLTFVFVYALRFSTNRERLEFINSIQSKMKFTKDYMKKILENEEKQYIHMLKSPDDKIAYNSALMENVFTSLVCLMNKIPILIIGNPGSSKSLSIKMLNSNLRGLNSASQFCKNLTQINMIYFQGSQSSTSKGVQQVFDKAIEGQQSFQKSNLKMLNCILFDQIGLAQKSVHNPLKVLHSKLQVNRSQVGFIAISNWELDAAKMSRFLVIARSNPDQKQVAQTAILISQSYLGENHIHKGIFQQLGIYYYKFITQWNSKKQNREGFFGLRDFYNYVKYVCNHIEEINKDPLQLNRIISEAIQINFDGQKGSLQLFNKIASVQSKRKLQLYLNPIELVTKNLEDLQSRCLMLIIKGDSLIPIINQSITINGVYRRVVSIYGSTFEEDQKSEDYNLEMTSLIINHVSRGSILAFKDINNSIQTSLYDLFNKSFSQIGAKKYCRIAVGANSNPKCHVHQNFNAIVYVDQQKVEDLDLPFLNRFQKHFLNLKSMISQEQTNILQEILDWINELLSFRSENMILKSQNFIINCSQQSIVTLIVKYRGSANRSQLIKTKLLQNRTTDFTIAMKNQTQLAEQGKVGEYIKLIQDVRQCKSDMIIFTYDQLAILAADENIFKENKYIISLSEIKNEKNLRRQLKLGLQSDKYDSIQIKVSYQHHYMHLNLLLFLSKQMKQDLKKDKKIIIMVQLHRFTLHQLNLQCINISYLHNFEQYFIQNIHSLDTIPKLLSVNNCWQLYEQLNQTNQFPNNHLQTLKLIKLKCKFQENQQLKHEYFSQIVNLGNNDYYKQSAQFLMKKRLIKKMVDYSALQNNPDDIMCSSNIEEALNKYLGDIIKEIIFINLKNIIEDGYLFYFQQNSLLKQIDVLYRDYLSQLYHEYSKNVRYLFQKYYQLLTNKTIQTFDKIRQEIRFKKAVQHNIITIKDQITLIPNSDKDFGLILRNKENADSKNLQELAIKLFYPKTEENEAQYGLYLDQCLLFISKQLKMQEFQMISTINKRSSLKKLYMFDILQYYLKYNNLDCQHLCHYIQLLTEVFKQYSIEDIFLIMTKDKRLFILLLDLFSKVIQFPFQTPKNIILQMGEIPKKQIGEATFSSMKALCKIAYRDLSFTKENIKRYGQNKKQSADKSEDFRQCKEYFYHFESFFMKLRQIMIEYEDKGMQYGPNILSTHYLLDTLQKISFDKNQLLYKFISKPQSSESLNSQIYLFFQQILNNQPNKIDQVVILNFLCLRIYLNWIQAQLGKDNGEDVDNKELKLCITSFINLCNRYVHFANNANFFINYLLPNFQEIKEIQDLMKYFQQQNNRSLIPSQHIEMQNNFSVTLGNFMSSQIQSIFEKKAQQNFQVNINELFICQRYYQLFNQALNSNEEEEKLQKLLKLQFLKKYVANYIDLLIKNEANQLLQNIDVLLCTEGQIKKHLRLYLLKILYSKLQNFQNIKKYFIDRSRCKWILRQKNLIEQKINQIFYPLTLIENNCKLQLLMEINKENKFSKGQELHDLIYQGLKNSRNTYELLTYFMYNFYPKEYSIEYTNKIKAELNGRGDLKQHRNKLVYELLMRYLSSKITDRFYLQQNAGTQQFLKQLPFLNYLNIVVAYRTQNSPLMDMFFKKNGQPFENYWEEFNKKYLFGSLRNPALIRINFILKRHKLGFSGASYLTCSNKCDFILPVGGNLLGGAPGTDGCQNPYQRQVCSFCGGQTGVSSYLNINNPAQYTKLINPESKIFKPAQLQKQMYQKIKTRTTVLLKKLKDQKVKKEYNLKGYQKENTLELIRQHQQYKKHYQEVATFFMDTQTAIHHNLLQSIIYFIWYFLVETNTMNQKSLIKLFRYNIEDSKQHVLNCSNNYFNQANSLIKFNNQEDKVIWHLGMGKKLTQILQNYKANQPRQNLSLQFYEARDCFQTYMSNIVFPLCEKEKEAFILNNRKVKAENKSDIVREIGNFGAHMAQYRYLKIFKLQKLEFRPCYKNMKEQYKQTLNRQYPLLAYLMNNDEIQQKLVYFKNIYVFLSRLRKMFNMRISRQDGRRSLQQMVTQYTSHNQNDQKKALSEMQLFIVAWNKLAQLNYQLTLGCHRLGKLQTIQKRYPLKNFLLDKQHLDNIQGQKLIAFVKISAKQYNSICLMLENIIKNVSKDRVESNIFSSIMLNPTLLEKDASLLEVPTQFLQEKIHKYSSFSVEYGISMPFYAFDHIQSMAAKQLYGSRYLIQDPDKFCYISYIGEQTQHFISELREDANQMTLLQAGVKTRIVQYIKRIETGQYQTFYKTMKTIQGSLENIVIFFKNFKSDQNIYNKTIRQFVKEKKIKSVAKEIQEEPIQSLRLSTLADLYELIEENTFEKVETLLDSSYKKPFEQKEKEQLIRLIRSMRSDQRQAGIPYYKDFKIAIYRLAARNLLLMMTDSNKFLAEKICYIQCYWPKEFQIQQFQYAQSDFARLMAKLEISRIGEILKLLPFKEKEEDINGEKNKKLDFRMRPAEAIFTNKEVKPKFKHKGKADKG